MICSEKELGISDEHEGVIILDDDAPVGQPLVDYMGDAVLEIAITPNIARDANILGVAREIAAITSKQLRQPSFEFLAEGLPIAGQVSIVIQEPELNPRFVVGLIREIQLRPSPYLVQRRLRLAGMRPINSIVDATNYAMLEIGEPLHAFDYDVLVKRAEGRPPTIITRPAQTGERLTTLDGVDRTLDPFTVMVCDTAGALSLAGVMGGQESEVSEATTNVLLEGAAWNFINTRRTVNAQKLPSEAAYRFSRGVHPAMAIRGVSRGLALMQRWAGGIVCQGLVDEYPLPPADPVVEVTPELVNRWLGIELEAAQIGEILTRLEFGVELQGERVRVTTPDHRLDIGTGIVGVADLMEEIARIYGYDRIPETHMADELPRQFGNPDLEADEHIADLLVDLGLQEVVTYRMTSPERESRLIPGLDIHKPDEYVKIANPIASDRFVLRRSLLASVLEVVERNARLSDRIALFEMGPVFRFVEDGDLPDETHRLAIALTGRSEPVSWQGQSERMMDFYDLKGLLEALFDGLHLKDRCYQPAEHQGFHPGKCARVLVGDQELGIVGELHPLVLEQYELLDAPLLAADLDLQAIRHQIPARSVVEATPAFPPVLEDLAVIVDEDLPAERVEEVIRQAGGKTLTRLQLFDVFRGEQIGSDKKSLAYSLTYQSAEKTLTDDEVLKIRQRIIRELEKGLNAR